MTSMNSRPYDLILLGATGFTGRLTAEQISQWLPENLSWAVAGRDAAKLSTLVEGVRKLNARRKQPNVKVIDFSSNSLKDLTAKTRVLIATVGPFHRHGTPILAACAHTGTHYLDSTGETAWVYEVAHKYHDIARSNGAILIPHWAMDSAPADLVAYSLVSFIRSQFSTGKTTMSHSIQDFTNSASGGTLHSLITTVSSYSISHMLKSVHPYSLCAGQTPAILPSTPRFYKLFGTHKDPKLGLLTDSIMEIPDTTLVYRSWSLMDVGEYFGGKFDYFTGMRASNRVTGLLWHYMMICASSMLLVAPFRWLLTKIIPPSGEGPSQESRLSSHAAWKAIAHSDTIPSQTVICDMAFKKDMYSLTAILLAEAAMVLLRPDRENWAQKLGGGVLTPATLGDQFLERVKAAGLEIDVKIL